MLRSVFTTFYRVRVWRCSSPWLSLYAVSPLSFFPLLTIKGAVEGSHLSSVLLYSRQKWDVSGPITALLTVTDDVCPSENTDKRLKTKPQTVSSSLLFQEIYWSHNGGKSLKISHCACAQCLNIIKNISIEFSELFCGRDEILGVWEFGNPT